MRERPSGKRMATARVRAATAERPSDDERKGRGGLRQQKEENNSKGRTARAEKSNGDSRKYGPEQRRTERGFRVGRVSEQRRFGLPECGGMRMEIDEFEPPAQSAANGVMCAAGGTVVPRDQQCGVFDKVVVTHGITPRMIGWGECHAMIGGSQHTPEAFAVHGREAALLSPERDYGDQPQTGHRRVRKMRVRSRGRRKGRSCFGIAAREDRFGGGEVEAHGHAAEEGPEAAGVQLPHRRAQSRSGLAPVSAVAGKSDGGKAVFGHTFKGSVLARTLQDFLLNLKLYTNMKHSANCLASFLGGALVGAVVAMLVTPKSGPEFREDIRDMAKKGTRKLKNEIDKIHCDCNGLDCDCDKDE